MGDPVAEVVDGLRCELVAAGLALRDGGRTGLGQQVGPGPVEELAGDDVVTVALGDEDGQVGQPAEIGGESGVEGQGAVEDGRAGVPGGALMRLDGS